MDDSPDHQRYPGPPAVPHGFVDIIGNDVVFPTSCGGLYHVERPTTSWFQRLKSSAALRAVACFWGTVLVASALVVAGLITIGLANTMRIALRFQRHGMLMILASALVVMASALFGICYVVKYNFCPSV
ncbi:hypothetical protein HPB50_004857 [Hyalomma asiaticum]|uniref:Uncharacterized protein n=1 Tax=Hyalomma asiaticum TaxID=266040 RepID=A0ACB7SI44_HYAAI|nr:hypothetical protein HPB50_004857 [Hyalomma asiaticum]